MIDIAFLSGTINAYYKGDFIGHAVAKTKVGNMCLVKLEKDYNFVGWLGKIRKDIPKRFRTEDRYYFFCMDAPLFKIEKTSAYGVE